MTLISFAPPAIIFVNNDLTTQVKNTIIKQLKIDQVFDGYVFDQIVDSEPNWIDNIKNIHNQRVLVIRNFTELQSREFADVVAFVKNGLISIEKNKFGPPINTFPVAKIHWGQLGIFVKQKGPGDFNCCGSCAAQCKCSPCSCGCKCHCTCLNLIGPGKITVKGV